MAKVRSIVFTLNNWTKEEEEKIKNMKHKYLLYAHEVGEEGTPHLQGYMQFPNSRSFGALCKEIPRWHIERAKGDINHQVAYIIGPYDDGKGKTKPYNPLHFEIGTRPAQGARHDLREVKARIMDGTSVDDICIDDPFLFHQYGRTLTKLEDIRLSKTFRTEMTKGYWYFGPTGTGKSHVALKNYNPDEIYIVPNDNGWWDGYKQQKVVVLNDFRGKIEYNELLQMVDKWPYSVKRRNRCPIPFTSETVIITSSLRPDEVYHRREDEDSLEQLYRRFEIYQMAKGGISRRWSGAEVLKGNTRTLSTEKTLDEMYGGLPKFGEHGVGEYGDVLKAIIASPGS